jgi:nucleoside-diphosphate-sugar epimerase
MRIFVLGGVGPVGRLTIGQLVEGGHKVTLLHRGTGHIPPSVTVVRGERRELDRLIANIDTDVVVDMVCGADYEARALISAFEGRAGRALVLSSADVYRAYDVMTGRDQGPVQCTPIGEDGTLRQSRFPYRGDVNPIYKYYDKVLVEEALSRSDQLPVTILRMPLVYGPGCLSSFSRLFERMVSGMDTIEFDYAAETWRACWSNVENVARAVALAITDERSSGRTYNVADHEMPTYREWVDELAKAIGWKGKLVPKSRRQLLPDTIAVNNPLQDWCIDSSRIRQELGFVEMSGWREALANTIAIAGA